LILIYWCAR